MATTQTSAILRQIDQLFGAGTVAGLSDAQLLGRFRAQRDEAAFVALVTRHGPMVLAVCRGVLRDEHAAEDAFQATFLILVRKAGVLWVGDSLGGWLHRVAHRVAVQARADAVRRRLRETRGAEVAARKQAHDEPRDDGLAALLHAEIARLPDRLRLPIVLCDLEGMTRDQAAARLGWTEGTVRGRLARARELLRRRLARRGVAAPAFTLAAAQVREATAAMIPEALLTTMARAAAGPGTAGAVAALTARVIRPMLLARLTAAAVLTLAVVTIVGTWAGLAGMPPREQQAMTEPATPNLPPPVAPPRATMSPDTPDVQKVSGARPVSRLASALGALLGALRGGKEFEYRGVVLDPAGKPVAGANVYLIFAPAPDAPRGVTGADGRFQFTVRGPDQLKDARVVVEADGFASAAASQALHFGQFPIPDPPDSGRALTIKLTEDQPIEGRVIDLEGRPVADAEVRVTFLYAPPDGDLTPWLKAVKAREAPVDDLKFRYLKRVFLHERRPGVSVKTDAQGRFTLRGLGRDCLADVEITAATIRPLEFHLLTRPGEPFQALRHPQFPQFGSITYYGATPRLAVAPSRPIEGVVRDKQTRVPIAGAIIESTKLADSDTWNDTAVTTTSDAQGRYRLIGMPRGAGNVIVAGLPPGRAYLPVQIEVENPPGLGSITLDIDLPTGIMIEGRVTDARSGAGVAAWVAYHCAADNPNLDAAPGFRANTVSHGRLLRVESGPDGRFKIAGLAGPGALVVETRDRLYPGSNNGGRPRFDFVPSIQGFHQAVVMIDIPQDHVAYNRDIALDPGRTLEGTVFDPDGKPLKGVQAYGLENLGSWEPLAGATFRIVALQPAKEGANEKTQTARSLVFLHPARKLAGWVDLRGDEPGPLRVTLSPSSTVGGRLVDPDGNPRRDVTLQVRARRPRLGGGQIDHEPARVRTDGDGRFQVEGLAAGLAYELYIQAPPGQRADRRIAVEATQSGETRDLGTIAIVFRDQE